MKITQILFQFFPPRIESSHWTRVVAFYFIFSPFIFFCEKDRFLFRPKVIPENGKRERKKRRGERNENVSRKEGAERGNSKRRF
jgi:hypothetical protein